MTRRPGCRWSSRGFGAVALAVLLVAGWVHAQTEDIICPLSEEQQNDSQTAWAKVAVAFKHDRCSNCHGKKNPFVEDTTHPDRMTLELDERGEMSEEHTFGICRSCHENTPPNAPWKTPPSNMLWWNQSVEELCRTQHKLKPPFIFIRHNENDPLIVEAFNGTMALNDDARDIVETTPYPAPPPFGHAEFLDRIRSWYAAQDLTEDSQKWQGDQLECGCVPQAYEMVIEAKFSLLLLPCTGDARISETIPLEFTSENGEAKYTGTGTGSHTVSNFSCPVSGCTVDYRPATTDVFLQGDVVKADGVPSKLTLTLARTVGPTSFDITCPCEDDSDCPYPVTISVPEITTPADEVGAPLDARLGTYEFVSSVGGTLTITVRKRN